MIYDQPCQAKHLGLSLHALLAKVQKNIVNLLYYKWNSSLERTKKLISNLWTACATLTVLFKRHLYPSNKIVIWLFILTTITDTL